MADRRSVSAARTPLTPEEVNNRSFSSSFRGLNPTEVQDFLNRIADELRASVEREEELQGRLNIAHEQLRQPPQIDESMVTSYLGEETARILKSAHEAAHEIRSKAEEYADRIRQEVVEEMSQIRQRAESVLGERTKEAEMAAGKIRQTAEESAAAVRGAAQAQADAVIEEARHDGRKLVQEAQALRAKVLGDLAQRRKIAHAQLEKLRAGRTSLLQAYQEVRQSLDGITGELQQAEAEARRAAEEAAMRVAEEPDVTADDLEAVLNSSAHHPTNPESTDDVLLDLTAAEKIDRELNRQPGSTSSPRFHPSGQTANSIEDDRGPALRIVGRSQRAAETQVDKERVNKKLTGESPTPKTETPTSRAPQTSQTETAPPKSESTKSSRFPWRRKSAATQPNGPNEKTEIDEGVTIIRPDMPEQAHPVEQKESAAPTAQPESSMDTPETPQNKQKTITEAKKEKPPATSAVEALFARLKANDKKPKTKTEEKASKTRPGKDQKLRKPKSEPATSKSETSSTKVETSPVSSTAKPRDTIQPLQAKLSKALKRTIQDEQNTVLDRVRTSKKKVSTDLLPTVEQMSSRYREAAVAILEEAVKAGAKDAGVSDEAEAATGAIAVSGDMATALAQPLYEQLEKALTDAQADDDIVRAATSNIGNAYREWKGRRIDSLINDTLLAAFNRGSSVDTGVKVS